MPSLLNIGSCSLHIVHGAFKTGAQATGWNIVGILRSLYYLFHDSPARSEDYMKIKGAQKPMKSCSTRLLEDAPVGRDSGTKNVSQLQSGIFRRMHVIL
jgi:hypothetical protein